MMKNKIRSFLVLCVGLGAFGGCDIERRKSDAELGLNPQQAAGRKIYDNYCDRCHRPYSTFSISISRRPAFQRMTIASEKSFVAAARICRVTARY
jgi:hypothetical protein